TRTRCAVVMRSVYGDRPAAVLQSPHTQPRPGASLMDRREFLAASAAAAVAPLAAAQKDKPMLPIVDTHQHLWDLSKFKRAWFDTDVPERKILGKNYTPKEYAEATKGLNVVKAVYMEVDVVPEQQQKEADYITELCESAKTPTRAAVISGRPNSEGFEKY